MVKSGTNVPTGATRYVYDEAGHLIGEYDQSGNAIQETVYLGDTPVATIKNTTPYYIYADQIDTPRVITDTNNLMVWRWDQADPFGAMLPDENPTSLGTFTYNLRFPGQVYDAETGKHYNVNRDYDPVGGRYIQSDPIGLNGGQPSTYAYVANQPMSGIDPLGLATQREVDAAITTLQQTYPAEFPKLPTSVGMASMGENGLGMTDWKNNIKLNSDRFGGRDDCIRYGDEYQFLQTLAHEMLHVNETFLHRLASNSFRMGNPLGYLHRQLDDRADVMASQRVIDIYTSNLKRNGGCKCGK